MFRVVTLGHPISERASGSPLASRGAFQEPPAMLFRTATLLLVLGAAASAQTARGKIYGRYNKPLEPINLDLRTGTITRGPRVNQRAASTTSEFPNLDLGGFTGIDTGGGTCEWFDAGSKGIAGNRSDLMNNVVFAYCSAMLTPASGGPGASARLGFYEGYTQGGKTPGTSVGVFTLTGLPANSASSSYYGGWKCFLINVKFANLVSFADGPIGYSWKIIDVGSDGTLTGTWPKMACAQSYSSSGPDSLGMRDVIDVYCPPGNLLSSFSFGTTPVGSHFTSMAMDIREATDVAPTLTPFNGENFNQDVLTVTNAVVGRDWSATVTIPGAGAGHGHGPNGVVILRAGKIALNTPAGGPNVASPLGQRMTELLIGSSFLTITSPHDGSVAHMGPVRIPQRFGLVGRHYAAQATVIGGGFGDLSTAVEGVVGSF